MHLAKRGRFAPPVQLARQADFFTPVFKSLSDATPLPRFQSFLRRSLGKFGDRVFIPPQLQENIEEEEKSFLKTVSRTRKLRIRPSSAQKLEIQRIFREEKLSSHSNPVQKTKVVLLSSDSLSTTKISHTLVPWKEKQMQNLALRLGASMTVLYSRPGRYYLCIPFLKESAPEPSRALAIALDPGIKTFAAGYDSNGKFYEWGKKLGRRMAREDLARGLRGHKTRDLIRDFHGKTASYLTSHFKHILLPTLETRQILREATLGPYILSQLRYLDHPKFTTRLKAKCEEKNSTCIPVSEHQSSAGCPKCGQIHETLGGSRWFKCSNAQNCDFEFDRDLKSSYVIYLDNSKLIPKARH